MRYQDTAAAQRPGGNALHARHRVYPVSRTGKAWHYCGLGGRSPFRERSRWL